MTAGRATNPAGRDKELREAAARLAAFTGRDIDSFAEVEVNQDYDVGFVLGEMPELHYIAERDGEAFHFHHTFTASSRPLLVVSHDGKQLLIAGGRYEVTDQGITDR